MKKTLIISLALIAICKLNAQNIISNVHLECNTKIEDYSTKPAPATCKYVIYNRNDVSVEVIYEKTSIGCTGKVYTTTKTVTLGANNTYYLGWDQYTCMTDNFEKVSYSIVSSKYSE